MPGMDNEDKKSPASKTELLLQFFLNINHNVLIGSIVTNRKRSRTSSEQTKILQDDNNVHINIY